MNQTQKIPNIVFIVPYRNRPQHKYFFTKYLTTLLADSDNYEIYFSHQCDARSFNRGATKNIGFLAVKNKYPNHYKDITFVFNDVDTLPFANILDYETNFGVVKHFYGFTYALGGIFSIKGGDFDATNGFPNFWGWGMEDNVMQNRCEKIGLFIDRGQFFKIGSPEILQLFDGVSRIINRKDPYRATHDNGVDGLSSIHKIRLKIEHESTNPCDNIHTVDDKRDLIFVININTFLTAVPFEKDKYYDYDLREPPRKIVHPSRVKSNNLAQTTDDWSNIPFYPTTEEQKDMIETYGRETTNNIIDYSLSQTQEIKEEVPMVQQYLNYYQNKPNFVPVNINKFSPVYSRILSQQTKNLGKSLQYK